MMRTTPSCKGAALLRPGSGDSPCKTALQGCRWCAARFVPIALFLFTVLALVVGAHQENKPSTKQSGYEALASVPEKFRAKQNPLTRDPEAASAGAVLFEEHCEECHGKEGIGTRKGPSLRVPEVQTAEPGALFYVLSNGVVRKGMPVWSKLPEPQRWQLVIFLKSLRAVAPENKTPGGH